MAIILYVILALVWLSVGLSFYLGIWASPPDFVIAAMACFHAESSIRNLSPASPEHKDNIIERIKYAGGLTFAVIFLMFIIGQFDIIMSNLLWPSVIAIAAPLPFVLLIAAMAVRKTGRHYSMPASQGLFCILYFVYGFEIQFSYYYALILIILSSFCFVLAIVRIALKILSKWFRCDVHCIWKSC